jgi:hypothetical protein
MNNTINKEAMENYIKGINVVSDDYLRAIVKEALYQVKEGTKASYYRISGCEDFPNRLSISKDELSKVSKSGRNATRYTMGQLVGRFTQKEVSMYKRHHPFNFRTQIWQCEEYPQLIGYGTIGITGWDGKIRDDGDLVVLWSADSQWSEIRLFEFDGFGKNPDQVKQAMRFVNAIV